MRIIRDIGEKKREIQEIGKFLKGDNLIWIEETGIKMRREREKGRGTAKIDLSMMQGVNIMRIEMNEGIIMAGMKTWIEEEKVLSIEEMIIIGWMMIGGERMIGKWKMIGKGISIEEMIGAILTGKKDTQAVKIGIEIETMAKMMNIVIKILIKIENYFYA